MLKAATGDVILTKMFLKILQISRENTCARVSFLIKLFKKVFKTILQCFKKFYVTLLENVLENVSWEFTTLWAVVFLNKLIMLISRRTIFRRSNSFSRLSYWIVVLRQKFFDDLTKIFLCGLKAPQESTQPRSQNLEISTIFIIAILRKSTADERIGLCNL